VPIEMAVPMISSRRMRRISVVYHDRYYSPGLLHEGLLSAGWS
jgi:hypothetical protein